MDEAFAQLVDVGVDMRRACKLVGRPRSTHYWWARPKPAVPAPRAARPAPANALSVPERERVLALLRDPVFASRCELVGMLVTQHYPPSAARMERIRDSWTPCADRYLDGLSAVATSIALGRGGVVRCRAWRQLR